MAFFREQRYTKLAEWDYVPKCAEATKGITPLWVCGDVLSYEEYYQVNLVILDFFAFFMLGSKRFYQRLNFFIIDWR